MRRIRVMNQEKNRVKSIQSNMSSDLPLDLTNDRLIKNGIIKIAIKNKGHSFRMIVRNTPREKNKIVLKVPLGISFQSILSQLKLSQLQTYSPIPDAIMFQTNDDIITMTIKSIKIMASFFILKPPNFRPLYSLLF
jgi:hypothetical protein